MRGVHAKSDLVPNTVCMTIPLRCLITVEMGQATEIGRIIAASDLDLDAPKHIYLMIYILWDRNVNGRHSFFDPYYQILPQTLHNMPIFWSDSELAELNGSYITQQIMDRNQAIVDDYNAICAIAPQMRTLATLQEFKWARMCVCSRNFGLCINNVRTSALVPHADMLNHYRPRETKWTYEESIQAFTITTLQHIRSGCEVLDSYGQKCNHRFLLNYGFAVEDNREMDGFCPNEVPIELSIFPNDPIFDEKIDFWIRSGTSTHSSSSNNNSNYHAIQYATHPSAAPNNNNTNQTLTPASREQVCASTLKRIRICVTNNDNTRLLFSLLRIITATAEEFRTGVLGTTSVIGSGMHHDTTATATADSVIRSQPEPDPTNMLASRQYLSNHYQLYPLPQQQPPHQSAAATINNIHRSGIVAATVTTLTKAAPVTTRYHRSFRDVRHPINLRNERESMKLLRSIVQRLLVQYPTTLQQDIDALHVSNLHEYPKFSNRRHAKIQIKGEKMVLHHYLKWSQTAIDVLNVIEGEIREEVERYNSTNASSNRSSGIEVRWQERGPTTIATDDATTTGMVTEAKNIHATATNVHVDGQKFTNYLVQPQRPHDDDHVQHQQRPAAFGTSSSFDMIIHRMELDMNEDDDMEDNHDVHQTILRYCSDVLGHVRQEEFRQLRKQILQQQKGNHRHSAARTASTKQSTGSRNNDKSSSSSSSSRGSEYV